MHQTIQFKLDPDPVQSQQLEDIVLGINRAANYAARMAFDYGVFSQVEIHRLCYYTLRLEFGLKANHAVRAIAKVVEAFARDRTVCPVFRLDGAVPLDDKLYNVNRTAGTVSIAVLDARIVMSFVIGDHHRHLLQNRLRQADLVQRDSVFYLMVVAEVAQPAKIEATACLGIDLGIVNIATTSEGQTFSGADIDRNRKRRARGRRTHQKRGSRKSKRRLKKLAGKQARYQKAVNHKISKDIVARATALQVGISLEDLTGIRQRLEQKVNRSQRLRLGNWGFAQLGTFIGYKAALAGIPVVYIDPRDTSRTCSQCGHCEKANRPNQAVFQCVQCGFSLHADHNAAINIAARGACSLP